MQRPRGRAHSRNKKKPSVSGAEGSEEERGAVRACSADLAGDGGLSPGPRLSGPALPLSATKSLQLTPAPKSLGV